STLTLGNRAKKRLLARFDPCSLSAVEKQWGEDETRDDENQEELSEEGHPGRGVALLAKSPELGLGARTERGQIAFDAPRGAEAERRRAAHRCDHQRVAAHPATHNQRG